MGMIQIMRSVSTSGPMYPLDSSDGRVVDCSGKVLEVIHRSLVWFPVRETFGDVTILLHFFCTLFGTNCVCMHQASEAWYLHLYDIYTGWTSHIQSCQEGPCRSMRIILWGTKRRKAPALASNSRIILTHETCIYYMPLPFLFGYYNMQICMWFSNNTIG